MAMTEEGWIQENNSPDLLLLGLGDLESDESDRKLRLFAVACCRRIESLFIDPRSKKAVAVAEAFAEGQASESELQEAEEAASSAFRELSRDCPPGAADAAIAARVAATNSDSTDDPAAGTHLLAANAAGHLPDGQPDIQRWQAARKREVAVQCGLVRDIFGNPFRPVTVDHAWQTTNVVGLAQAIYDDRAFDRLPIFADALEGAGCTNGDVLMHCRQPGEHVRGCWVVDLVLGKA